ncbi:hypothetical protein ABPG74_014170 [Tetrahymena malaccensis]
MRKKPAEDELKAISVNTERELQQYFDSFQKTLIDTSADWNQRLMSLKQFQGLILGECYHMNSFEQHLINIIPNMIAQVNDLRSAIQKEACKSLVLASEKMGNKFENAAIQLFKWEGMLHLLGNGKKILADTAHECIEKIITNVPSSQYFSVINDEINSKNNNVRIKLTGYLNQMLRQYENKYKEKNLNIIEGLIIKTCKDASSEVRANSRQAYNSLTIEYPELSDIIYQQFDNTTKKLLSQNTSNIPEADSSAISGTSSIKKVSSSKRSLSYINQSSAKSIRSNPSISNEDKKEQLSIQKQENRNSTPAQTNVAKSANSKNVRIVDNRASNSVGGIKRTVSVINPAPAPKTGYSKVAVKSASSSPGTSLSRPQTNQKVSNQNTLTTDEKSSFFKKTSQKLHQNRMNEIKVNDFSIDENQEYNLESVKSQSNIEKINFFKNDSLCDQNNQSSLMQNPSAVAAAAPTTLISNQLSLHLPISNNSSISSQIFKNNILATENNIINQDSLFKKVQEDDLLLVTKESSDEDDSKKIKNKNSQNDKQDAISSPSKLTQINKFHSEELSFQGDFKPQSGMKQSAAHENNLLDSNLSKETPTIKPSQQSPKYDFFTNQNAVVEFDLHHEDLLLDELNELNENSLENPKFLSQNFLQDDDYSSSQIQQEIRMLTYDHNNQEITPINSQNIDNQQFSHFNKNNSTNLANSQLNQYGSNQASNNIIHPLLNLDKISTSNISQNQMNPGTGRNSGSPVLILSSREKSISQTYEGPAEVQGQKDQNLKNLAQSIKLGAQQRVQQVQEDKEHITSQFDSQNNQILKSNSKNQQNIEADTQEQDLERELKELTERQKQKSQVSESKSKNQYSTLDKTKQENQQKQEKNQEKPTIQQAVDNDKNKSLAQRSAMRSLTTSVNKNKINSLSLKKEEQSPQKSKLQDSNIKNATPQTATQTTKQKTLSLSLKQTAQKQTNAKINTSLAQSEVNTSKANNSNKQSQSSIKLPSNLKKPKEDVKINEKNIKNKIENPLKVNKNKEQEQQKSGEKDKQIIQVQTSQNNTNTPNKNSQAINIIENPSVSNSNSIVTHPDNISTDKKLIKQSSYLQISNINQIVSEDQEEQVPEQLTSKSTKSHFILQQYKTVESQNTMMSSKSQNEDNKIQTFYSSNQDGSTSSKKSNQNMKFNQITQESSQSPKRVLTQQRSKEQSEKGKSSLEKSSPNERSNNSQTYQNIKKQEQIQNKQDQNQQKQVQSQQKDQHNFEQNNQFIQNTNQNNKKQENLDQQNDQNNQKNIPISNQNNNYIQMCQNSSSNNNQQLNITANNQNVNNLSNNLFSKEQNMVDLQSQQNQESLKYITDQQNKLIQLQQQQLQQQQNQLLQLQQQQQQIQLQQQQYQQQIQQQIQQQQKQLQQQPQNNQSLQYNNQQQNENGLVNQLNIQNEQQQNNINKKFNQQYPSVNNFESYLPITSYSNLNQIQQTNQTDYTNNNNNYINRQLSPQSIHSGLFLANQQNSYFPANLFTNHTHKNSNELPQYNTQTFNNSLNNTRNRNWPEGNHERVNSDQFYQNQNEGEEFYQRQNYFIQQQLIQQQAQLKQYYEEMLANQYEKLAKGFQEQFEKSINLIQEKIQSTQPAQYQEIHNEEQNLNELESKKKSKKKQDKSKNAKSKNNQNQEIFSESENSENNSSSSFNMNKFLGSFNNRNKSQQIPSNSCNSSKNQFVYRQNWHQATKSNPVYSQNRLGSNDQLKSENLQMEELDVHMNPQQIIKVEIKKLKSQNWATKLESIRRINRALEQYEQIDDLQVIKNLIEITLQQLSTEQNIQIIEQLLVCTSLQIQFYSDHYQNYLDTAVRLFIKAQQSKKQSVSVQAEQIVKLITDSYSIADYLDILLSLAISEKGIENKLSVIQIMFPVLRRNQIHLHETHIIQQICLGMSTLILQNQEIKQIQMSCFAILNYTLEFGRDICIESIVRYNSSNEDDLVNFRFLACIYSPQLESSIREFMQFNCLMQFNSANPLHNSSLIAKAKQRYSPIRVIPTSESLQMKPMRKEGMIKKQIQRSNLEEKSNCSSRNRNSIEQTGFLIDNFTSNENVIQENINEIIGLITQSIQELSQSQQENQHPLSILEKLFQNQIYFHTITKTSIKKILNLYYFYPHNQMEFLELDEIVNELEYVQPTKKLLIQSLIEKIAEKTSSFQQGVVKSHFIKLLNKQIKDERNYTIIVENMEIITRIQKKVLENQDSEEIQANKQTRKRALKCLSLLYFCDQKEMNQQWQQFTVEQQKEIAFKIKELAEKI